MAPAGERSHEPACSCRTDPAHLCIDHEWATNQRVSPESCRARRGTKGGGGWLAPDGLCHGYNVMGAQRAAAGQVHLTRRQETRAHAIRVVLGREAGPVLRRYIHIVSATRWYSSWNGRPGGPVRRRSRPRSGVRAHHRRGRLVASISGPSPPRRSLGKIPHRPDPANVPGWIFRPHGRQAMHLPPSAHYWKYFSRH